MKAGKIIYVLAILCLLLFKNAFAFSWDFTDETNYESPESTYGLLVGSGSINSYSNETQPIQISGAGTLLPAGYSQFKLDFHAKLNTWDVYNPDAGFFDVFAVVLSEQGYYWNLSYDDKHIHPLENNSMLLLGYDPFNPVPGPTDSYWGGGDYRYGGGGYVDTDVRLIFNTDPAKEYYLTLFLQTMQDIDLPSWGTISNLTVTTTPEPASMFLFLSGFGALAISRRFRRKPRGI